MKMILKKNQVIISVIAIMLIAAGYMNYTANNKQTLQTAALKDSEKYGDLGDATLVSANAVFENVEETGALVENTPENTETVTENTVSETSVPAVSDNQYFAESKLEREKMYSQMLESYQKIINNSQISDTQKEISQNEIKKINDTKNAIMISENLLKNKGFEDLIIFVNGDSISVVIKAKELTQEQIAQVQNIIVRELKADIENIHISNKE
ncbi:MAG: SpoIIIAH-like family protein [Clostridium sp.]|nr:SpoIIIAH-like family protein [Clostridium sp.]